ncbi:hypothetical protein JOM56_013557 [Amanita muscaria]
MKLLLHAILFFAAAGTAIAQSVQIGYPPAWTNVHPGQSLTVQIVQPNSIEGSFTLGIALGIQSCVSSPCAAPSDQMGNVLYNGPFNPKRHPQTQPYQNFTVQIPTWMASGSAQLNVAYAALWGAGASPSFDTLSEPLNIL